MRYNEALATMINSSDGRKADLILKIIDDDLQLADKHHLQAEVVVTALQLIQENPNLSVVQAMSNAMVEWDILS